MEAHLESWSARLVRACQLLIAEASDTSTPELLDAAREFARRLEAPTNHIEEILLRYLLLDVVLGLESRSLLRGPNLETMNWILQAARSPLQDLPRLFVERVRTISGVPERGQTVDDDLADRAARVIEYDFARCHTVHDLACRLDCHPRRLQEHFRSRHQTTVHRYLDRVRAAEAIRLIAREGVKVDAATLMVGLKSRKNLYQLLKRTTGLTLSELRETKSSLELGRARHTSRRNSGAATPTQRSGIDPVYSRM